MAFEAKKAVLEFNIEATKIDLISQSNNERLIYNVDDKYFIEATLDETIDENKIILMNKLIDRYIEFGLKAPKYLKNNDGNYIYNDGTYNVVLYEKLEEKLLADDKEANYLSIIKELYEYIGKYSTKYRGVDIYPFKTPYSVIDLAPHDSEFDEKQVNLNSLCDILKKAGFTDLMSKIIRFNERIRDELKEIYKKLPRCNYQANLTNKSILVKDNHFVGLTDFTLCGSEVIVNYISNEARTDLSEDDFINMPANEIYNKILKEHKQSLSLILKNYEMLPIEKKALELYNKLLYISAFNYYTVYKNVLRTKERNKVTSLLYMLLV